MSKVTKILTGFVVTAVTLGFMAAPVSAAFTAEQMAALSAIFSAEEIAMLEAIAGGSTTTTTQATGYVHSYTLMIGASGTQVSNLQSTLNMLGAVLVVDGQFGPATKAAVMSYQAGEGLSVDGVVGPATGAALASYEAPSPDPVEDPDDPISGFESDEEGQLTQFEEDAPEKTEIDEGEEEVELLNVSFEADDADQLITRVDIDVQAADSTESDKPWDYFTEVFLTFDGEIVASMDADRSSDWDRDSSATPDDYSMRFSGLELLVEENEEVQLGVMFSALSNVDGNDEGQSWEVAIPVNGIRALSPNGYSETYPTSELNEDFTVAGSDTGTLEWSKHPDNPDAMAITLDDTNDTDDVLLAVYRMEADHQDIFVEDVYFDVTVTSSGTADQISDLVETFHLYVDGDLVGSDSASTATALSGDTTRALFSNADIEIDDGDTVKVEVYADFQPLDGTIITDTDTITVSVDASDTVAEQNSGGDKGDSVTATGDITGESHAVFFNAPVITLVSSELEVTCAGDDCIGDDDTAKATFVFTVEAVGADVYLPDEFVEDIDESNSTYGDGSTYYLDEHGGTEPTVNDDLLTSDADASTNGFVVYKGETKTFTATVNITAAADGSQSIGMSSIEWSLTDVAGGNAATEDYTYSLQPDWETDPEYLNHTA